MAKWMFDPNAETEEQQQHDSGYPEQSNPGLTSPASSVSHSTAEEYPMTPFDLFPFGHKSKDQPKLAPLVENDFENVGKLTLEIPQSKDKRNKLRKSPKNDYDSDGGYVSERSKKAKKSLRWRRKDAAGGYSSDEGRASQDSPEAKRTGVKNSVENSEDKPIGDVSPYSATDDPEAFLATINASLLPGKTEDTPRDGYLTDSTTTTKRGRTKQPKAKKTRTRPSSPTTADEDGQAQSPGNSLGKKRSFFNMMARSRSASRDKHKEKRVERSPTPPPVPPVPLILPIADRFARPSMSSLAPGDSPSVTPEPPRLSSATEAQSVDGLSMNSGTTSSTLVPSRDLLRTASPLNYMNAISLEPIEPLDTAVAAVLNSSSEPARANHSNHETKDEKIQEDRSDNNNNNSLTIPVSEDGIREGISKTASRPTSPSDIRPISPSPVKGKKLGRLLAFASGLMSSDNHHNNNSSNSNNNSNNNSSNHNNNNTSPKISAALISGPNPLLAKEPQAPPSSQDIISALNSRALSPAPVKEQADQVLTPPQAPLPSNESLSISLNRPQADGNIYESSPEPSTSYIVPSPTPYSTENNRPSSPTHQTLASRRAMNIRALTPIQGTNIPSTPSPSSTPSQEEVMATRQAVLAYYSIPPPSPPPTGPLPPPPPALAPGPSDDRATSPLPNQREDRLQPPLRSLGPRGNVPRASSPLRSLSPTPNSTLSPGGSDLAISRSPSPRLPLGSIQQQGAVRRGRESPFPMRPVLPPQDSRDLVERVERYKAMYSNENAESAFFDDDEDREDEEDEEGMGMGEEIGRVNPTGYPGDDRSKRRNTNLNALTKRAPTAYKSITDDPYEEAEASSDDGIVDTRSSAYIRAARARGEKRVYFASGVPMVASSSEWDVLPEELEDPMNAQAYGNDVRNGYESAYGYGYEYESQDQRGEYNTSYGEQTSTSMAFSQPDIRVENIEDEGDEIVGGRRGKIDEDDEEAQSHYSVEEGDINSRRGSIASASVYSRYSVLEPERSAEVRDGFVRSVAAMRREWEKVPDVPALPPDLREANFYDRKLAPPSQSQSQSQARSLYTTQAVPAASAATGGSSRFFKF